MRLPNVARLVTRTHDLLRDYWPGYLANEVSAYGVNVHDAAQAVLTTIGFPLPLKSIFAIVGDTQFGHRMAEYTVGALRRGVEPDHIALETLPYLTRAAILNAPENLPQNSRDTLEYLRQQVDAYVASGGTVRPAGKWSTGN